MMFDLIIASLNEVSSDKDVRKYWKKIERKITENLNQHLSGLIYWSQIGEELEEDGIFRNTDMLRSA